MAAIDAHPVPIKYKRRRLVSGIATNASYLLSQTIIVKPGDEIVGQLVKVQVCGLVGVYMSVRREIYKDKDNKSFRSIYFHLGG